VGEQFQLHLGFLCGLDDRRQGHLPGEVDPANPLLLPEPDAAPVNGVGLGGKVDRLVRGDLVDQLDDAGVGGNPGVEGEGGDLLQVFGQAGQLVVARIAVDGQVDLHPVLMGMGEPRSHLRGGEVIRQIAQAEGLAPQVDGIGAVVDGNFQFFQIARRGKEFG